MTPRQSIQIRPDADRGDRPHGSRHRDVRRLPAIRCGHMRSLVLVFLVAACDPVWHVDNVATAKQPATPTEACVEGAIKASGLKVSDVSGQASNRPARDWYVGGARVQWDPKTPT